MHYYPNYMYKLPAQKDSFNCGIYVGLYVVMLARTSIEDNCPADIQQFRYKLALALEKNDVLFSWKCQNSEETLVYTICHIMSLFQGMYADSYNHFKTSM